MPDPLLHARDIGLRFGDFRALSGVSLAVPAGTIHAVIGPNGAGKTTLFNVLTGTLAPQLGAVRFAGRDVTRLPVHARLHLGMARSFQVTNLFPSLTVAENVRLAVQAVAGSEGWVFWRAPTPRGDMPARVARVLATVGLAGRAGDRAGDLSHGAQRLLEIGLAIASEPRLVFLDEPLAGMGIDDIARAKALLRRLKEHVTVLLIEHNMGVVLDISDRITVLSQGRTIAEGVPEHIRNDPAVREAYLGSAA